MKRSNQFLETLEPGVLLNKLTGLISPPNGQHTPLQDQATPPEGVSFVGVEAGRLEVEKARLELELAASRQRVQVYIIYIYIYNIFFSFMAGIWVWTQTRSRYMKCQIMDLFFHAKR